MAAALAPHGGLVIWRAFVADVKPGCDRAGAAYENLHIDGRFASNSLLQVKNGPIDFQPRDPFAGCLAQCQDTSTGVPDNTGIPGLFFGVSHPDVAKVLDSDTYAKGPGSAIKSRAVPAS